MSTGSPDGDLRHTENGDRLKSDMADQQQLLNEMAGNLKKLAEKQDF